MYTFAIQLCFVQIHWLPPFMSIRLSHVQAFTTPPPTPPPTHPLATFLVNYLPCATLQRDAYFTCPHVPDSPSKIVPLYFVSASKYAAFGFTEALDEELRADGMAGDGLTGIHLTTVCPMFVDTNLVQKIAQRCELTGRYIYVYLDRIGCVCLCFLRFSLRCTHAYMLNITLT